MFATVEDEEHSFEEDGSGDRNCADDEDCDDESGSGEGEIIQTFQIFNIETDCTTSFLGSREHPEVETEHPSIPHVPSIHTSNADKPERGGDTIHLDETAPPPTPDSASSLKEWRAKRLIITYFLPIVMAWFGGSLSAAVSDLL